MAKTKTKITITDQRTAARFIARLENFNPQNKEYKAALFKIGTLIKNTAQDELTSQGAVNTGGLRAAMSFRIESSKDISRVVIGPFGKRYARIVELGGPFTDRMRKAMFANFRERGVARKPGKGVISGGYYRARPYMHPAFEKTKDNVTKILRDLVNAAIKDTP